MTGRDGSAGTDDVRSMFAASFERSDGAPALWIGPRSQGGNYVAKVQALSPEAAVGGEMKVVEVLHDAWCLIYRTDYCNCDPEISL